ncbi:coxsackievirus and adenovirus receptor homolog [Oreochromis aureus]|nr:coxsackievirus and adenovirus receptor homolog [Oreochromis aureus]
MAAVTAWRCSTLLFIGLSMIFSADLERMEVKVGQNIVLPCQAVGDIQYVKWERVNLGVDCVLKHRRGEVFPDSLHPSFENRAHLQDRQMKDGNLSLIIREVKINDIGTYECNVMRSFGGNSTRNIIDLHVSVPPVFNFITAESGQDVILPCRAPDSNVKYIGWTRDDLGFDSVYRYEDGHFRPVNQHPSFKNRVDLQDRQMKDGDVSLILKNVTSNDAGTYLCKVIISRAHRSDLISSIYLVVDPPGPPKPRPGDEWMVFGVGFALSLCLVIAVVGFCTYTYRLSRGPNANRPHQTPQQLYDLRTGCRLETSKV